MREEPPVKLNPKCTFDVDRGYSASYATPAGVARFLGQLDATTQVPT